MAKKTKKTAEVAPVASLAAMIAAYLDDVDTAQDTAARFSDNMSIFASTMPSKKDANTLIDSMREQVAELSAIVERMSVRVS